MARRPKNATNTPLTIKHHAVRKSVADMVFESLLEAILSNDLPSGTPLIEVQLAEQFLVSKTPIREAIQRLVQTGLVDFELARGATVHTLTQDEIRDIFEMRILIEPMALQQSAPHLTKEELIELENVLERSRIAIQQADYRELSQQNSAFHHCLVRHATNHLMLQWLDSLSHRRRLISLQGWSLENRSERELEEHHGILQAVQLADFQLAADRLARHITRFSQIVLSNQGTQEGTI